MISFIKTIIIISIGVVCFVVYNGENYITEKILKTSNQENENSLMYLTITDGIAIDSELNKIMFLGRYSDDCFKRLFSIPLDEKINCDDCMNKGPDYEYSLFSDQVWQRVNYIYQYTSKNKQLFVRNYFQKYQNIAEYIRGNNSLNVISADWYPNEFEILEDSNRIISTDDNTIKLYNIPSSEIKYLLGIKEYDTLYNGSESSINISKCKIKTNGDDLYIAIKNKLYKGSLSCRNCSSSDLIPQYIFNNIDARFYRIQISSKHIYFIYDSNVYRVPLNVSNNQPQDLPEPFLKNVTDIKIYQEYLYFVSQNSIQKLNLQSENSLKKNIILDGNNPIYRHSIENEGFSNKRCDLSLNNITIINNQPICLPNTYDTSRSILIDGKCYQTNYYKIIN